MIGLRSIATACAALLSLAAAAAHAQPPPKEPLPPAQGIGVDEMLGGYIPLDARFTRADGTQVEIGRFFNGEDKPVVLVPVYFDCPIICPTTLGKLGQMLDELDYTIGEDFNVIVLSFDHTEGQTEAYEAKILHSSGYREGGRIEVLNGWGFLTGSVTQIRRVTDAIGFRFKPIAGGEYSHPSLGAVILSPDGKITRYIYGLDFPADQIRFSLLEASEGRIAESLGDVFAFACFRWDPQAGKYTASAMAIMRIAGGLTVLVLIVLITTLFLGERVRRRLRSASTDTVKPTSPAPPRIIRGAGAARSAP
ncbi:MAG: SCO family protein [Planctomycetota bacterium]